MGYWGGGGVGGGRGGQRKFVNLIFEFEQLTEGQTFWKQYLQALTVNSI